MRSSKRNIIFGILLIVMVALLGILVNSLTKQNSIYINKIKHNKGIIIKYPYFNDNILDDQIKKYVSSINNNTYDVVNYKLNNINGYISILFEKEKNNKIIDYDYIIFNHQKNQIDINEIISNLNILQDKINIYLSINNISIENYPNIEHNYYLLNNELEVILNNKDTFEKIKINYNEISDILKMAFEIQKDYVNKLTTTTTIIDNSKVISFTFDDGPSKYTSEIMDVLDKYGAKATFFEVGYMIKNRKETVLEVLNRGYEIGNHTTDHSNLNKLTAAKVKEKVYDNNATFKELTGYDFPLLRPPYGNCKQSVKELINVPIIKWSVDSRDWESRNTDKIVDLVKKQTSPGDIVLFHDLYPTTLEAIKILVPYFYENGYRIVSVSELFDMNDISLENGKIYYSAK